MADFVAGVIAKFKVDTKDAKRKLKQLTGEERKMAAETLKLQEAQNEKLESQIATWGKVAGAIGAATGAILVLKDGFREFAEDARLRAASANADIGSMAHASNGLIKQQDLLKLAARGVNSEFKSSQKELETAAKFVVTLRNRGVELEDALEKVGQTLQEGNIEPLKEFGFIIDAQNETIEGRNEILRRMAEANGRVGASSLRAGDEIVQASVAASDAWRDMRISVGKLADAMTPLIKQLAKMVQWISRLKDADPRQVFEEMMFFFPNLFRDDDDKALSKIVGRQVSRTGISDADRARVNSAGREAPLTAPGGSGLGADVLETMNFSLSEVKNFEAARKKRRGSALMSDERRYTLGTAGLATGGSIDDILGNITRGNMASDGDLILDEADGLPVGAAQKSMGLTGKQTDMLDTMFGTPDAFSAKIQLYSAGFDMLQSATQSAFDAWITGSMGVKDAIKSALAEMMRSQALQMASKAVEHLAWAAGSLAFQDYKGAAKHGIAAAKFGAAAVGFGIAAKKMGAGQGGAAVGGLNASGGGGAAAGASGGGRGSITVVLGDNFADMSPHERNSRMKKTIVAAKRQLNEGEEVTSYA